jgi:hypothetical protein
MKNKLIQLYVYQYRHLPLVKNKHATFKREKQEECVFHNNLFEWVTSKLKTGM